MTDFQKFLSDIASPYWWLSVIVVGLLVSVLGNFLYKVVEKLLAKYSVATRRKAEVRKAKQLEEEK